MFLKSTQKQPKEKACHTRTLYKQFLFHWKRLEKSKRMVEYYQRNCPSDLKGNFLYEVKGANKDKTDRQFTGTYVPQELILVYERTKYKNFN